MTSTSKLWETITKEGAAGISYKSFMSWLIWYIYPGDQPWREALKYVWGDSSISVNVTISNLFFRSTGISKYQTGSYTFLTNKKFYKMFQWMFLQAVVINAAAEEGRGGERVGRPSPSPPTPRQYFFLIQYHISEQGGRICAKHICPNIEMNPLYA